MRIPRVYVDLPLQDNGTITLPSHTSHYLVNVLRLKKNAAIQIFNGKGEEYRATISLITKKNVTIARGSLMTLHVESPLVIHLGQGISKGERMDFAIQKAVELGVTEITPLITDFCTIKINKIALQKKCNHWQAIMISACEQSGRTVLPELKPVMTYSEWLGERKEAVKIICHPDATTSLQLNLIKSPSSVAVIIGPEGGISNKEFEEAKIADFLNLRLGSRILRTETATIVALTYLQSKWGDVGK